MTQQTNQGLVEFKELENVNTEADLPDPTQFTEPQLYHLRSGDLAPDYISTSGYDGTKYTYFESLVNGNRVSVPDYNQLYSLYDWSIETGTSTVTDRANSVDLSGSYTGQTTTINNLQSGRFNGDEMSASFTPVSTPVSIFVVMRWESLVSNDARYVYDSVDSSFEIFLNEDGNSDWQFGGASFFDDGAADLNNHVVSAIYKPSGSTSELYIDGGSTADASGDIGSNSLQGLKIGNDGSTTNKPGDFSIGEMLVYDSDKSQKRNEIENYLGNRWGIATQ